MFQNTETNEVQKITTDANSDNLRLIAIHKAADPKMAEVVLSDGTEEGSVKFRLEVAAAAPQQNVAQPAAPTDGAAKRPKPSSGRAGAGCHVTPGPSSAERAAWRFGANQQGMAQMQTAPGTLLPPRASEARRKRITPPPVVEQPVGRARTCPEYPQLPSNLRPNSPISCVFALFFFCCSV